MISNKKLLNEFYVCIFHGKIGILLSKRGAKEGGGVGDPNVASSFRTK